MDVTAESVRSQVERLVNSKTFETSEVHRRLLQYLTEKALNGEADRLKEYTIGLEAFGKPQTYDPRQDSIVRLQIGRLRQKLSAYYESEANGDNVLVSLPKGAFKLNFEVVPAAPETLPVALPPRPRPRLLVIGLAASFLWAAVVTAMLVRTRLAAPVASQWTPELTALWQPFLESNRSLLLCFGAPLFVRFPGYGFFRDPRANDWEEVLRSERVGALRKTMGDLEMLPAYSFTGAGEAGAGVLLAKLLSPYKRELLLTRSNLLSWQQITDHDLIFIGPPKFNLQLQTAAMAQDIVVEADGVRNLKPQPGEPEFLTDRFLTGKVSEGETHALISRTAGPSGAGEMLTIAGNASPDTLAAAEWLTQPFRAKELVARLRTSSGQMPRHFQVVVKVAFKQGIPVQSSYVFHHILR
jgi:hypothetical protein